VTSSPSSKSNLCLERTIENMPSPKTTNGAKRTKRPTTNSNTTNRVKPPDERDVRGRDEDDDEYDDEDEASGS